MRYFVFILRLEYLKNNSRRFAFCSFDTITQRPFSFVFFAEPQRSHQRNLRAAADAFAAHRPRPDVGDGPTAIRVGRIEFGEFLFRRCLHLLADVTQRIGESVNDNFFALVVRKFELRVAVARDVFEQCFEDEAGDGIEVAGKDFAAEPQGFQWNRAAARKRVNDDGRFFGMRSFDESPANFQIRGVGRVIPI